MKPSIQKLYIRNTIRMFFLIFFTISHIYNLSISIKCPLGERNWEQNCTKRVKEKTKQPGSKTRHGKYLQIHQIDTEWLQRITN